MPTVKDISDFLGDFAPTQLAEEWDNVGLLVGDPEREVRRIMTCLTVTLASADEAARRRADLVVAHHPLPFRPLKRLTTATTQGRLLLQLIAAQVAVYSPHTAFDSAPSGINQRLAEAIGLTEIRPLVEAADGSANRGAGRCGRLPGVTTLSGVVDRIKQVFDLKRIQAVGASEQPIERVAVACGSAGEFLAAAIESQCDLFITGETSFHTSLEAEAKELALVLLGHYASERFAVETLAQVLTNRFRDVEVWPSHDESDPLRWM